MLSDKHSAARWWWCLALCPLLFALGCDTGSTAPQGEAGGSAASAKVAIPAAPHVARGAISFVDGYQRGCEVARRERKPMLLFFTASWCQYCHQMANEAFNQTQVTNLSQRFVCVLIDADAEPQVCQHFQVRGYPTVQFLSPEGAPLHRVVGKRPGTQFLVDMQTALQAVARLQTHERVLH
jgi:thioredoxin-like negative regulator of GroEL